MTVKVEITVTVETNGLNTTYGTEDHMYGDNPGFIADNARVAVHRALKRVLAQMPVEYKSQRDGLYDVERKNYCEP